MSERVIVKAKDTEGDEALEPINSVDDARALVLASCEEEYQKLLVNIRKAAKRGITKVEFYLPLVIHRDDPDPVQARNLHNAFLRLAYIGFKLNWDQRNKSPYNPETGLIDTEVDFTINTRQHDFLKVNVACTVSWGVR